MTLSTNVLQAILKPFTEQVFLHLLEISHPLLSESFRFVANTEDIEHQGKVYEAFPFLAQRPAGSNQVTITLDNAERTCLPFFMEIAADEPAKAILTRIMASEPDTVIDTYTFEIRQISANARVIVCTCLADTQAKEGAPSVSMTPNRNPGLFGEGD